MKIILIVIWFLFLTVLNSFANTINDVKYGEISEKVYIYINKESNSFKTGKLDLDKIFYKYNKVRDVDRFLTTKSDLFMQTRDAMLTKYREAKEQKLVSQLEELRNEIIDYDKNKREEMAKLKEEKVKDIMLDVQRAVEEYAIKNQLRAVFVGRLPHPKRKVNVAYELLPRLNEKLDITNTIISYLN